MRIIKVSEIDHIGFEGNIKYFSVLSNAKKCFKKLVNNYRKWLVNNDACYFLNKPINYSEKPKYKKANGRKRRVTLEIWNDRECNDVECSTQTVSIVLEEVRIEDL